MINTKNVSPVNVVYLPIIEDNRYTMKERISYA